MKKILSKMFEHGSLSRQEARQVMHNIADGLYNDSLLSAFMTVFLMRSITIDELVGFRDAVLERRLPVDLSDIQAIDIVGTGGDGKNTFNISTASCFVVAGAGRKVIKHGNFGSTSVSGASNVLQHNGVKFPTDSDSLRRSLDVSGVAYLHAPLFSPALKSVAGVRKALGVRTFFNMLGPLVNPSMPQHQMLGVYNLKLFRLYNYIAQREGVNCTVVHSLDGYDEISLTSEFKVSDATSEKIYTPAELGFEVATDADLWGGETIDAASKIFLDVLADKATTAQKNCVIANAAFALRTLEPNLSVHEAIELARHSIESGNAMETFKKFLSVNS